MLLVPLYLTVVDVPIVHWRLIDSYWAVWLPAGASALNIILMKRFFDNLPREIFEAARVDGAGRSGCSGRSSCRCRGRSSASCPCSRSSRRGRTTCGRCWCCRDPDIQPLSVRLPILAPTTDLGVFIAALTISSVIPIALFLIFQRLFLSGAGVSGALKG